MATKRAKKQTAQAVDKKSKDLLTEGEMKRLLDAAKGGRYGQRDYLMLLMTYRHGLRVSELIDLRLKDMDLDTSRLFVRRKKGSLSTHQPIEGDELRALRAWLRERSLRPDTRSPYLFLSERGPFTRQAINYITLSAGERAKLPQSGSKMIFATQPDYMLTGNSCNTSLVAHPVAQREAVDQFGDDEVRAVVLTDVEDGEDVRVVEGRGRAGLAREAGQGLRV